MSHSPSFPLTSMPDGRGSAEVLAYNFIAGMQIAFLKMHDLCD